MSLPFDVPCSATLTPRWCTARLQRIRQSGAILQCTCLQLFSELAKAYLDAMEPDSCLPRQPPTSVLSAMMRIMDALLPLVRLGGCCWDVACFAEGLGSRPKCGWKTGNRGKSPSKRKSWAEHSRVDAGRGWGNKVGQTVYEGELS